MAKRTAGPREESGSVRRVPAKVTLQRTSRGGQQAFIACVWIGVTRSKCHFGSNPRSALARALNKASSSLKKRSGAFRGAR